MQETWLRWDAIGEDARADVRDPRAFLVRTVTRKSLDRLRSTVRRREEYVGEWHRTRDCLHDTPAVGGEPLDDQFGAKKVANLLRPFSRVAPDAEILRVSLNGTAGLRVVCTSDGADTAISFLVEDGLISRIYAIRNPAKLGRIHAEATLSR